MKNTLFGLGVLLTIFYGLFMVKESPHPEAPAVVAVAPVATPEPPVVVRSCPECHEAVSHPTTCKGCHTKIDHERDLI